MSQTVGLGEQMHWMSGGGSGQLCPVALIPQVIQQMTTYRCRIIMIGWPGISCFCVWWICSTKTPKWVNLLVQFFSNRLHNNLAYLNLHDWHLESGMNIMKDSQRKWWNNEGALLKENLRSNCSFLGSGVKRARFISQTPLFHIEQISWNSSLRNILIPSAIVGYRTAITDGLALKG